MFQQGDKVTSQEFPGVGEVIRTEKRGPFTDVVLRDESGETRTILANKVHKVLDNPMPTRVTHASLNGVRRSRYQNK